MCTQTNILSPAVLGKPTVEIDCDSPRSKAEGYWSPAVFNLGDRKKLPSLNEDIEEIKALI
jgi:heptosyltransferase-1